jgi:uncharacterized protein (DUF2249 family)
MTRTCSGQPLLGDAPNSRDMTADTVLDVRDTEGEPFGDIVAALQELDTGATLELINSFEPEPLYDVLRTRGFEYESERVTDDEWHVWIRHAD